MNSKKMSIAVIAFLTLAVMLIGTASACTTTNYNPPSNQCSYSNYCSCLKLPPTVTMTIPSAAGVFPFQEVLSGFPPTGYSVTDTSYVAFCADLSTTIYLGTTYTAELSSSLCGSPQFGNPCEWNQVNYILNNNNGNGYDIQAAIWLIFGFNAGQIQALAGLSSAYAGFSAEPSTAALQMYHNALAYGRCFDACYDKIIAVIVCVPGYQTTLIELKNPCCCSWGCYWDKCGCDWGHCLDQCGSSWGCDVNRGDGNNYCR